MESARTEPNVRGGRAGAAFRWALVPAVAVSLASPACAILVGGVDGTHVFDAGGAPPLDGSMPTHGPDGGEASARDASVLDVGRPRDVSVVDQSTPPGDAGPEDAHDSGDPDSGIDSGPVNLLVNPSFEEGIVAMDCGAGWTILRGGTFMTSPIAHTGAASCMICPTTTTNVAVLAPTSGTIKVPEAGPFLVGTAFLRGVADAGRHVDGAAPSASTVIYQVQPGGANHTYVGSATTPTASGWIAAAPVQVQATLTGNDTFSFEVFVNAPSGGCVLVDDVGYYLQSL